LNRSSSLICSGIDHASDATYCQLHLKKGSDSSKRDLEVEEIAEDYYDPNNGGGSNTLENIEEGATVGATVGGAIGSLIPGVGTVIGGAVGTIAGAAIGWLTS